MNEKLRAFLLYPPIFGLIGAIIAAPHIVHLLDKGSALATVGQIARGELDTRNVKVTGLVRAELGVRMDIEEKGKEARVSFFMPMCDQGDEGAPTQLVVHTFHNEIFDAVDRPDEPMQFEGTVRDVLWEGLDSETKDMLAAAHPLSPDVKLLELRGIPNVDDRLWGYGAPIAGLLLGLFAASASTQQPKPKQPEAAA